ncbi:hypothetical protein [Mariprofundus ferrooxydans]|uniref:hypothetical protein n=1 Tax=Mariprofundus ferrooxydans TaxID=314344 RepID=UPI001431C07F|nr:hypothetical protein [Mariprofundus ferrooxydans]
MIVDHIKSFPGTDSRNLSPSPKPVDTHPTIILLKNTVVLLAVILHSIHSRYRYLSDLSESKK